MTIVSSALQVELAAAFSNSDLVAQKEIQECVATLIHVESDPLWANLIETVIAPRAFLRYEGVAFTGESGLALCRRVVPDMVVLDLSLPDMDGFHVVDEMAALPAPPRVLVLTSRADDYTLDRLQRWPISGVVWKAISAKTEICQAADLVAAGATYFPPNVRDAVRGFRSRPDVFSKFLSRREQELMPLFGSGMSDGAIAARTSASTWTIHSHRKHIMAKLGLHKESALVIRAIEMGFVHIPRLSLDSSLPRDLLNQD